jgi:ribosome-associated protein
MELIEFELRGEYITLDALLKVTGLSHSGGGAKALVASGKVAVDGQSELRKTCKIRAGQVVAVTGTRIRVHAAAGAAPLPVQDAGNREGSAPSEPGPPTETA